PRYGRLSRRSLDELRAGARVEVDPDKRHPADFAVWKRAKPGEPAWPSPWGPGRPGWHIECSVMALKYLGSGLDFHGGGTDLIFPHHENEIAQSEAYTGQTFCRFWVHHEMLNLRGEKMSKSLGNVVTLGEVLDRAPGGAVRLLLLGAHYRKPLDFDFDLLEENKRAWRRLNEAARRLREAAGGAVRLEGGADEALAEAARAARRRFEEAMDDDFNTAEALGSLFDLVRAANAALAGPPGPEPGPEPGPDRSPATGRPEEGTPAASGEGVRLALAVLEELGGEVLGLVQPPGEREAPEAGPADELVSLLLEVRSRLREKKDFALADFIREGLVRLGYEVQDGPRGSVARRRD
ncbi:MAG: class I tRNA ligase family protein, partial [Firmicutes bacterium]|nr:class I tRNA ligase family protein [Bacillota bacterium]